MCIASHNLRGRHVAALISASLLAVGLALRAVFPVHIGGPISFGGADSYSLDYGWPMTYMGKSILSPGDSAISLVSFLDPPTPWSKTLRTWYVIGLICDLLMAIVSVVSFAWLVSFYRQHRPGIRISLRLLLLMVTILSVTFAICIRRADSSDTASWYIICQVLLYVPVGVGILASLSALFCCVSVPFRHFTTRRARAV